MYEVESMKAINAERGSQIEKVSKGNLEKFLNLDQEKQDRIVSAAMKEFQYGYKKANTEAITKEAGISKGLLFYYFGTKEQLYAYIVNLASLFLQQDIHRYFANGKQDILEIFRIYAIDRRKQKLRFPFIYDFLNGIFNHWEDNPKIPALALFEAEQSNIYEDFYTGCDMDLFREDLDIPKAIDIIIYVLDGLLGEDGEDLHIEGGRCFEKQYKANVESYIATFRKSFYKSKEDR